MCRECGFRFLTTIDVRRTRRCSPARDFLQAARHTGLERPIQTSQGGPSWRASWPAEPSSEWAFSSRRRLRHRDLSKSGQTQPRLKARPFVLTSDGVGWRLLSAATAVERCEQQTESSWLSSRSLWQAAQVKRRAIGHSPPTNSSGRNFANSHTCWLAQTHTHTHKELCGGGMHSL